MSTITFWGASDGTVPQDNHVIPYTGSKLRFAAAKQLLNDAFIEVVNLDRDTIMMVDEDGHAKGLPLNVMGTILYNQMSIRNGHGPTDHQIVGPILVGARKEFEL